MSLAIFPALFFVNPGPQPQIRNYGQQRNADSERSNLSQGRTTPIGYPIPNGQPVKHIHTSNIGTEKIVFICLGILKK